MDTQNSLTSFKATLITSDPQCSVKISWNAVNAVLKLLVHKEIKA